MMSPTSDEIETRVRQLLGRETLGRDGMGREGVGRDGMGREGMDVRVISHLSGGYTNDNYLVEIDQQHYVARLGSSVARLLGVDRHREQQVLRAASGANLIPEIMAFAVEGGDMLSRYVAAESAADRLEGNSGLSGDARTDINGLARLLRRAHALDSAITDADPREWIIRYVAAAETLGFVWPDQVREALPHLGRIAYAATALTHHDVNPWNILHATSGDLLLDWEYAGRGDPAFDLAGACALWSLPETQQTALLDGYGADDVLRSRLPDASWLFHLRELTWAGLMLAAGINRSEIAAQYTDQCAWLAGWFAVYR